jgi:Dihydrofolate reductase
VGAVLAEQPDQPFATFINGVTKYVATSTPLDRDWANATVLDGGLVEFVRDLKQQRGGDVGVHASISVAQALLAADVVDELRLVIAPRIAGRGRRLLDGLPSIQLESIRSEISPTGFCSSTIALFVRAWKLTVRGP